jgi:predicted TIM-barrel fold metal-dependent hydrolase
MLIDSHCHAWEYWPYEPSVPDPESRGRIEQLINQMDINGVQQATIVSAQIEHNPNNNDYIADAVRRYPSRLYQYADVDCSWSDTYHTPGAASRMEAAIERWPMKGFTHYLRSEDDGSWLTSQDGLDFFRVASDAGLIASIAGAPHHQAALRKVAEALPSMPILSHHMAGLKASEPPPHTMLNQVLESAKVPNMYLKLSGFSYLSDDDRKWEYPYSDTLWIYKAAYERYGTRMVWGSDYPAVNFFMTHKQSLEAFRTHCTFVSDEAKAQILGGTLAGLLEAARGVRP